MNTTMTDKPKLPKKITSEEINYVHNLKTAVRAIYKGVDHRDVQTHIHLERLAHKINAILDYLAKGGGAK